MSVALVLGGAACLWSDLDAALALGEFDAVIACNDAAASWPGRLDAAVSLHPEKFGLWMTRRVATGYRMPERTFSFRAPNGGKGQYVTHQTPYQFPGQTQTGSSGLFALKVALTDLGCDRAVLCGIPLTADQAHFFDPKTWRAATSYRDGWKQALPQIKHRARSMSGWTAELLGQPDEEWLGL